MKLRTIKCIKKTLEGVNGEILPVRSVTYEIEKEGFFGFEPLLDNSGNKMTFDSKDHLEGYMGSILKEKREVRTILKVVEV